MKTENKLGKNAPKHSEIYDKHMRESLEAEKGGNLIHLKQLKETLPELADWLKTISRYGNVDSISQIFRDKNDPERHFMYIFTDEHYYSISAYAPTKEKPKGYLGCIASNRKNRVGEWWSRGNDLSDGPYNKETFISIMGDIISMELKTIQLDKINEFAR